MGNGSPYTQLLLYFYFLSRMKDNFWSLIFILKCLFWYWSFSYSEPVIVPSRTSAEIKALLFTIITTLYRRAVFKKVLYLLQIDNIIEAIRDIISMKLHNYGIGARLQLEILNFYFGIFLWKYSFSKIIYCEKYVFLFSQLNILLKKEAKNKRN